MLMNNAFRNDIAYRHQHGGISTSTGAAIYIRLFTGVQPTVDNYSWGYGGPSGHLVHYTVGGSGTYNYLQDYADNSSGDAGFNLRRPVMANSTGNGTITWCALTNSSGITETTNWWLLPVGTDPATSPVVVDSTTVTTGNPCWITSIALTVVNI